MEIVFDELYFHNSKDRSYIFPRQKIVGPFTRIQRVERNLTVKILLIINVFSRY